jgi:hypothetical protein
LGFPSSGAGAAERSACRAAIFSARVIGFSVWNPPVSPGCHGGDKSITVSMPPISSRQQALRRGSP